MSKIEEHFGIHVEEVYATRWCTCVLQYDYDDPCSM